MAVEKFLQSSGLTREELAEFQKNKKQKQSEDRASDIQVHRSTGSEAINELFLAHEHALAAQAKEQEQLQIKLTLFEKQKKELEEETKKLAEAKLMLEIERIKTDTQQKLEKMHNAKEEQWRVELEQLRRQSVAQRTQMDAETNMRKDFKIEIEAARKETASVREGWRRKWQRV